MTDRRTFLSVMMASGRKYHTLEIFTKNDCETRIPLIHVQNIDEKIKNSTITHQHQTLYMLMRSNLLLFIRLV